MLRNLQSLRLVVLCWLTLLCASAIAAEIRANILLQDSPLAGFQFYAGKKLWPQMQVGDVLVLVREPQNVHDRLAIRVEWNSHHIGYVPRRENRDIARLLNQGEKVFARISRLAESRDPWARVRFEILTPLKEAE